MSNYKNYGQAAAFGENSRSDNNTFVQSAPKEVDLAELAKELTKVRAEMAKQLDPANLEQIVEIGVVAQAEKAATAGEPSRVMEIMRGAGRWTLEVAKSVTADLVKDALEGKT